MVQLLISELLVQEMTQERHTTQFTTCPHIKVPLAMIFHNQARLGPVLCPKWMTSMDSLALGPESLSLGPAEAPVRMSSVRPLGLTHKSSLQVRGTDLLTSAFVAAPPPLPYPSRLQISLDSDNTSPFPFSWRDACCLQLLLVPGSLTIPSCFFIAWPHLCIVPSLKFFFSLKYFQFNTLNVLFLLKP